MENREVIGTPGLEPCVHPRNYYTKARELCHNEQDKFPKDDSQGYAAPTVPAVSRSSSTCTNVRRTDLGKESEKHSAHGARACGSRSLSS